MLLKHKEIGFETKAVSDDGTFWGYGSVFGNVDLGDEIVAPGAFAASIATIKASGNPLPALWQHKTDQPIGGYSALAEDSHGLKIEGFLLIDDVPQAKAAHALLKRRVLQGLSIGYRVKRATLDQKTGIRTLHELDLAEISVVTFPMNELAQVDRVKAVERPVTTRDFEASLRTMGFSRKEAARIALNGFGDFQPDADEPEFDQKDMQDALARLRSITTATKTL